MFKVYVYPWLYTCRSYLSSSVIFIHLKLVFLSIAESTAMLTDNICWMECLSAAAIPAPQGPAFTTKSPTTLLTTVMTTILKN